MKLTNIIAKRTLDVILSIFGMIILMPFFLVISFLIKIESKGPVFFKQKRLGMGMVPFEIYKFRTMYIETPSESPTDELEDAQNWITKTGTILRKTSLDEIPQLLNIIKGDMSIVGPRPALWNQYYLNSKRDSLGIHSIRPGLTGLAQVNGRDENNDDEKVFWDKEYLDNQNLILDLKCIFNTVIAVFKSDGVVEGKQ